MKMKKVLCSLVAGAALLALAACGSGGGSKSESSGGNSGKTEIVDINAAIDAIAYAMATFKNDNTVDVTAKIVNPNFDSNINGWTCEGGDGNNFQRQTSSKTNFNGGFLELSMYLLVVFIDYLY